MNNRRKFLAAGGVLAAISALPKAKADQPKAFSVYLHGMVWNRQLEAPRNDWLIRLDAKADIPIGHKVALKDLKPGDTAIKYGEDIGKIRRFLDLKKSSFISALDEGRGKSDNPGNGVTADRYGVRGYPTLVMIDHHAERRDAAGSAREGAKLALRIIPVRQGIATRHGDIDRALLEKRFDGHRDPTRADAPPEVRLQTLQTA